MLAYVENKVAHTSASWLSEGLYQRLYQRLIVLQEQRWGALAGHIGLVLHPNCGTWAHEPDGGESEAGGDERHSLLHGAALDGIGGNAAGAI